MDNKKKYDEILRYLSYKTGLSRQEIKDIYNKYWSCIKNHIKHIDLESCNSEQDLIDKKASVNVQNFGKFYFSWKRINKVRENIKGHV